MLPELLLALAFLLIAFLYASVGFGGGSSYLALLALAGLPFTEIRFTALVCNVIVVTGGVWVYWRNGQVDLKKVLPLVLVSVPAAYFGATLRLTEAVFFQLLGYTLLIAALMLWFQPGSKQTDKPAGSARPLRDGVLGGGVGWLSGMVGIGGGIFLSPLLFFLRWDTAQKIAATASVFILVNSLSGLAAQIAHWPQNLPWARTAVLAAAVLIGGQTGSRLSNARFDRLTIRRLTALLVLVAGLHTLFKT